MSESFRFTENIRSKLREAVLTYRFKDRLRELGERDSAFALRVYKEIYGPQLEIINSLPDGYLPEIRSFYVVLKGSNTCLNLNSLRERSVGCRLYRADLRFARLLTRQTENISVRVPYNKHGDIRHAVFEGNTPLTEENEEILNQIADLANDLASASTLIVAALERFTTSKQALEAWPELAPFLAPMMPQVKNLPALPREDLNKKLGLPVEVTA